MSNKQAISSVLRTLLVGGIFIVPFITVFVFNELYFPFITGKAFAFRILTELLFALWIILALYDAEYRPKFSWIVVLFVGFLISIGISDVFAVDKIKAFFSNFERMEGYITLVHLFMYFIVLGTVLKTERMWRWFFHTWIGVGIFLSLYGIEQILSEFEAHLSGERIDATLGNATYLAVVMIFMIFFVLYYGVRERDQIKALLSSLGIGSGLFVGYTILVYSNTVSTIQRQLGGGPIPDQYAPDFFLGEAHMTLFTMCLVVMGISAYLFATHDSYSENIRIWFHTSGYTLLGILFTFIMFNTRTRGAILGLLGGLSLTMLLIALFARARPRLQRIMAGLALVGMIIGGLFVGMVVTNTTGTTQDVPVIREAYNMVQDIPGLNRVANIDLGGKTVRSRFFVWGMASQGFAERPLFGWGQGNFHHVFNKHYDPRMFDQEPWFDRAHNVFFDWLIAGGLVGGSLYFGLIFIALGYIWYDPDRGIFQRMRTSTARIMRSLIMFETGKELPTRFAVLDSSILSGLIAAYFFHNLFVFDNLVSYLLFFGVLAFIYSVTADETKVLGGTEDVDPRFITVVASIVAVIAVSSVYVVNIRPIYANANLLDAVLETNRGNYEVGKQKYIDALALSTMGDFEIRAGLGNSAEEYIRNENVPEEVKNDIFVFAMMEFEKQIAETPESVRTYVVYGNLLTGAGHLDRAYNQYQKALELSPTRQAILFQLANIHFLKEENQEALDILKTAFLLEPRYEDARAFYAYSAILVGDEAALLEAMTHEGELTENAMALNERIINAYIQTEDWDRVVELMVLRVGELEDQVLVQEKFKQHVKLVSSYTRLAGVYVHLGQQTKALELLKGAQEKLPENAEEFVTISEQIKSGSFSVIE